MIVQIKGNVTFPITLDPTVWIFDDRKIVLEEAFSSNMSVPKNEAKKKIGEMFDQEVYFQKKIKPPVNKSIKRFEKDKILSQSYVIPIQPFIKNAELSEDAKEAILKTNEDDIIITVEQLMNAYLLFSKNGKPLVENGPVHLYFGDGSNKKEPFKGVYEIVIK